LREDEANKFTEKELEIIQLICKQLSSKEIGTQLQLTRKTIENYRNKIFGKTKALNMAGVVVYAFEHGLYKP
jgi:DNA-binding NarL/FixJ family response regulator